jgi:hypothetical protein
MKLSEIKTILPTLDNVVFQTPDGSFVPEHFHVTEVGSILKHFIDCGGTVRKEQVVNFQLWNANDFEHRLKPGKLLKIIQLSEERLGIEDHEIEVEYQGDTIGKYGLSFNGKHFVLVQKSTACLASDACGIPAEKQKLSLKELTPGNESSACCTPGGGCC